MKKENSFKKYYTIILSSNNEHHLSSASYLIEKALERGEININEYEVLESQIKTHPFLHRGEEMDYVIAELGLTVSENFLYSLFDAIKRIKRQIDKTSFKDDEREMASIFRKSIRELECKITTAFHWWYLKESDPNPDQKDDDPFFDTKQKRVCYLNNEMLRWATELYTDDNRCKGDTFFESKFFKQNIKPELAYIYVSLKNAKVNECGFVVPR